MGSPAFQLSDTGSDPEFRITVYDQVDMIRHDFHLENSSSEVCCDQGKQLLETFIDTIHKHLAPILRTKDDVILAVVDEMTCMMEWTILRHFHVIIIPQEKRNVKPKSNMCSFLFAQFK